MMGSEKRGQTEEILEEGLEGKKVATTQLDQMETTIRKRKTSRKGKNCS